MRVEPIDFNTFSETTEKLNYSGIFTTENYPEIIEQIELFELGYYERVVQFVTTSMFYDLIFKKYKTELEYVEIVITRTGFVFDFYKFLNLDFRIQRNIDLTDSEDLFKYTRDEEDFQGLRSYFFQMDDDESIKHLFLNGRDIIVNGELSTIYFKLHNIDYLEDERLNILSRMVYILDKLNKLCTFLDTHRSKFKLDKSDTMKKMIVIF